MFFVNVLRTLSDVGYQVDIIGGARNFRRARKFANLESAEYPNVRAVRIGVKYS